MMQIEEIIDKRFNEFGDKIDKYVISNLLPGLITLVYQTDKIIDCRIHGYKNFDEKTQFRIDDIFRIASMTKPVVTVALLMLLEQGKLTLDDRLSKLISNAQYMQVFINKTDNEITLDNLKQEITILDLLTHTSGFMYPEYYNSLVETKYKEIFGCEFLGYDIKREKMTLEQFAKLVANVFLKHQPSSEFTYGISTDIIGYIIEQVSGQKLDYFLEENIFNQLDMTDTGFYVRKTKLPRLVPIHSENLDHVFRVSDNELQKSYRDKSNFLSGGAGLTSTISDYLKFALMLINKGLYNGRQIIKRETFDLMTTDFTTPRGIPFSYWDRSGFTNEYRMSFDPFKRDKGFCLGLKKKTSELFFKNGIFSWFGIYGTYFWIDPDNKIIGMLFSQIVPQSDNYLFYKLTNDFEDFVYRTIFDIKKGQRNF